MARMKTVMGNFFPQSQEQFRTHFSKEFYEKLIYLKDKKDNVFLSRYSEALVPTVCTEESVQTLKAFILKYKKNLSPVITKPLRIALQEDERCLKIPTLSETSPPAF